MVNRADLFREIYENNHNKDVVNNLYKLQTDVDKSVDIGSVQKGFKQELGSVSYDVLQHNKLNSYTDAFLRNNSPVETSLLQGTSEVGSQGLLEKALSKTKMTPEQIENNATILKTGALCTGLYFGIKWLFGSSKDKTTEVKKGSGFIKRAAIVVGSLIAGNMVSEAFTGKSGAKLISDIVGGKTNLTDVFAGKTALPEARWGHVSVGSAVLRDIPYSVLSQYTKKNPDGTAHVDLPQLRNGLMETYIVEKNTTTKQFLDQKIQLIDQIIKENDGQIHIDKTLKDLGVTKKTLSTGNKNETLNNALDEWKQREIKLATYEQTHNVVVKDKQSKDVLSYLQTNSPTLEELVKSDNFVAKNPLENTIPVVEKPIIQPIEKIKETPIVTPEKLSPEKILQNDMNDILKWNTNGVVVLKRYNEKVIIDKKDKPYIDTKTSVVDIRSKKWYAIEAHHEEVYIKGEDMMDGTIRWQIFMPHDKKQTPAPLYCNKIEDAIELAHLSAYIHHIDRDQKGDFVKQELNKYNNLAIIPKKDEYEKWILGIDK